MAKQKKKKIPLPKAKKAPFKIKAAKKPKVDPAKLKIVAFNPEIKIYATPETLFQETAHLVMQMAREAADNRGRFVAALSGGSTPKGLFQQLTEEPYLSLMPWEKTYFFWVDERHVAQTDKTSNYRMAQEFLLSKVPIPKDHVFPMTTGTSPVDQSAARYEVKMGKLFGTGALPRFDLSLMGMGDDGHTASLFPGMPQVNEQEKWVVGYFVDEAKKERISLTFPVLNASRLLLVLVEGLKKAERVKAVLEGSSTPPKYPIQYLRPQDGRLIFALDAAAASLLSGKPK
ncbi:MAG TPA: 6-phosphogluconolactonase [bacterium]